MFGAPAAFWDQEVTLKMEASTGWREKKMEDALVHDGCETTIPFMRKKSTFILFKRLYFCAFCVYG